MKKPTIKDVFKYVEDILKKEDIVEFSTWHSMDGFYQILDKSFDRKSPIIEYNARKYILSSSGPTDGRGGMSDGFPASITIKKMPKIIKLQDIPPLPVKNPDFGPILEICKDIIQQKVDGTYHEDNNDDVDIYEAAMEAIYSSEVWNFMNN